MKTRRNEPCHCGSGIKFKRCCLGKVLEVYGPPKPERKRTAPSGSEPAMTKAHAAAAMAAMLVALRRF